MEWVGQDPWPGTHTMGPPLRKSVRRQVAKSSQSPSQSAKVTMSFTALFSSHARPTRKPSGRTVTVGISLDRIQFAPSDDGPLLARQHCTV